MKGMNCSLSDLYNIYTFFYFQLQLNILHIWTTLEEEQTVTNDLNSVWEHMSLLPPQITVR